MSAGTSERTEAGRRPGTGAAGGSAPLDCGAILRRYRDLAAAMGDRYGAGSQAVVFVRYEELLTVRSMLLSRRGDPVLESRLDELRTLVQELYTASAPSNSVETPWRTLVSESPPVVEYSRAHFDSRYRAVSGRVMADTVTVTGARQAFERLAPRTCFMFAVTDEGELRVWNRAFELHDLAFGRNRATVDGVPVAHPMLVPERLRVRAAGEVLLLGRDRVEMVVANTKSGHFRPPPQSAAVMREVCRSVLGLADRDIDVFTLFTSADTNR
ncbi:hypothetical protein AB0F71_28775 [Kitasatospora sp. NPDC028055]|uniref:hypothetical protein n=1 Tax=unclassified Kitasatospora TaxID=2633591 RepID=UPI0033EC473F